MTTRISEVCWDAVAWVNTLAQADADAAVQALIDRIAAALRHDLPMPPLSGETWRLLLADPASRSSDELGAPIDGKVDIGTIVKELESTFSKAENRKPRKQANAEPTEATP